MSMMTHIADCSRLDSNELQTLPEAIFADLAALDRL
jgi:hypothetical protein